MEYVIRGGTLVSAAGEVKSDLRISEGRISDVGPSLECAGAEVVDASGCLVFPGFIDVHTHLDMENSSGFTADDFTTGTRAALAGGTTCIVDYATQDKGGTLEQALELWNAKARGKAACDYGFHMSITDWNEDIPRQMEQMCRLGLPSFKIYLAYDSLRLTSAQAFRVLECAGKLGAVVCCHCEDGDAVNLGIAEQKALGHFGTEAHPASRPNPVEAAAVEAFLNLAEEAGAEAYVVHLSTKEGLEVIRNHRNRGQRVWAETCPQYLTLTDAVYSLPDFEGAKFVCSPPIRTEADREALWNAVRDGEIQVVATDHCSYTWAQKLQGRDDFTKIPNGLPGLQHRCEILYGLSCGQLGLSPSALCALLSENPARIFGMWPQKGSLLAGADADIVIWDPDAGVTVSAEDQLHAVDYTPFEGMTSPGSPRTVFLRGEIAVDRGRVTERLDGRFIQRKTR